MIKQLKKHIEVTATMRARTGLRIGAGKSGLEIGGLDNPIIRHPETRVPYVPGSSLKGKLRSLLETREYRGAGMTPPQSDGQACKCNACVVCWLFGCGDPKKASSPTRLLFRDCAIRAEDQQRLAKLLPDAIFYSEVKPEVTMDRSTGKVGGGGPRSMDRIMAGTALDFRLTVRVFEGDNEGEMKKAILTAIELLEKEGLGASVSRGYGEVRFENLTWDGAPMRPAAAAAPAGV